MNWLAEEDLKVLSDGFFDDLINHVDFPQDDGEGDWEAKFRELEPPPMDIFTSLPSQLNSCGGRVAIHNNIPSSKQSGCSEGVNSNLHKSLSPSETKVSKLFQSSSPVSVLESSEGTFLPHNTLLTFAVKGVRSKRKRPTTLRLRYLIPMPETLVESESKSYDSYEQYAKKKRKTTNDDAVCFGVEASNSDGIIRKCTHCETTKTPQWREGPNGPKTLCNACGVRFRSGRLVPEYRPASSPTFIPSVHSNSHRKIIEMRRKEDGHFDSGMIRAVTSGA